MLISPRIRTDFLPSLPVILFCLVMTTLWVAGGSSRADALGQAVVRFVASLAVMLALTLGPRPAFSEAKPAVYVLGAAILLAVLHLVPLPPSVWQALPGREILGEAVLNGPQPARPLAMVPGAALNAALSLIVPVSVLLLLMMGSDRQKTYLLPFMLGMIVAAGMLALLQFSGARFDNPLINESVGLVSGNFANRNHLALFLAFGCLLTPVWAFGEHVKLWRGISAAGLMLLFTLLILATGSRAGLVVSVIAICVGLMLAWPGVRRLARRLPKRALPAALVTFLVLMGLFIFVSMTTDRAAAIDRFLSDDIGQDMRSRSLPTVLVMIKTYFPTGAGLGSFDAVFRMHEPLALLKLTYFNHAHNDFLEIALTAGLPGLLLLAAAIIWWLAASVRVWRARASDGITLGRLGSAMLLLVFIASVFDYPARTPMMMAMIVVAAVWLGWGTKVAKGAALPAQGQHL